MVCKLCGNDIFPGWSLVHRTQYDTNRVRKQSHKIILRLKKKKIIMIVSSFDFIWLVLCNMSLAHQPGPSYDARHILNQRQNKVPTEFTVSIKYSPSEPTTFTQCCKSLGFLHTARVRLYYVRKDEFITGTYSFLNKKVFDWKSVWLNYFQDNKHPFASLLEKNMKSVDQNGIKDSHKYSLYHPGL